MTSLRNLAHSIFSLEIEHLLLDEERLQVSRNRYIRSRIIASESGEYTQNGSKETEHENKTYHEPDSRTSKQ